MTAFRDTGVRAVVAWFEEDEEEDEGEEEEEEEARRKRDVCCSCISNVCSAFLLARWVAKVHA